ncbi:hypothetical protein KM043_004196 [Ampulex compressa]|nr:hypothetical protein KM043_004196 [Ampulex compressa]
MDNTVNRAGRNEESGKKGTVEQRASGLSAEEKPLERPCANSRPHSTGKKGSMSVDFGGTERREEIRGQHAGHVVAGCAKPRGKLALLLGTRPGWRFAAHCYHFPL